MYKRYLFLWFQVTKYKLTHLYLVMLPPMLRAGLEDGPCNTFLESRIIPETGSRPKYFI